MPDETTPASLDQKVTAFLKKVEEVAVKEHKIDRKYARDTLNEYFRDRIVVGGRGPVRILRPGTLEFYEGGVDFEDIAAPVLSELVKGCPDEHRLEAVKEHEAEVKRLEQQKAASGQYRL